MASLTRCPIVQVERRPSADAGVQRSEWQRLHGAMEMCLQRAGIRGTDCQLIDLDRGRQGQVQPFSGAKELRWRMLQRRARSAPIAALLVGLRRKTNFVHDTTAQAQLLLSLLAWPGVVYLEFGFDVEGLVNAARKAVDGAKTPLPAALTWTAEDLHALAAEVRHWAENRQRNLGGARDDFRRAADAGPDLHVSYFEPVDCLSSEHREMIDRLIDCERDVAWLGDGQERRAFAAARCRAGGGLGRTGAGARRLQPRARSHRSRTASARIASGRRRVPARVCKVMAALVSGTRELDCRTRTADDAEPWSKPFSFCWWTTRQTA